MCNCHQINCGGCHQCQPAPSICSPCNPQPVPCDCPVRDLSTDCILYTSDNLPCTSVQTNTVLTDVLKQIDAFICTVMTQATNSTTLVNVGTGAKIYSGIDTLGRKKIRTLVSSNNLLTIDEVNNTLDIKLNTVNEYADNAAAVLAGLAVGRIYRTGDLLKIVH